MNEQTKTMTQETQNREDFIMLPTVDFCFKELNSHARLACYTMNKTGVASGSFS